MLETIIISTISIIIIKSTSNYLLNNSCISPVYNEMDTDYLNDYENFLKYHDAYDDILLNDDYDIGLYLEEL